MTDPTPTPPLDLPALKEIAQAEPSHRWGQWTVENDDWDGFIIFADDGLPGQTIVAKGISQGIDEGESTANFIAALDPPTVLALIARAEAAEAKVAAVRELHAKRIPTARDHSTVHCDHCGTGYAPSYRYPCPTIAALDGAK